MASHLLQEQNSDGLYTYIYTDQDSYEPLTQIRDWTDAEDNSQQQTNYFHCDHIGIPREMTDKNGKLLWAGEYDAWGKVTEETNVTGTAHQPFRLQNQYCDHETGGGITISSGITTLMRVGLSTKTRLALREVIIYIGLHLIYKNGLAL